MLGKDISPHNITFCFFFIKFQGWVLFLVGDEIILFRVVRCWILILAKSFGSQNGDILMFDLFDLIFYLWIIRNLLIFLVLVDVGLFLFFEVGMFKLFMRIEAFQRQWLKATDQALNIEFLFLLCDNSEMAIIQMIFKSYALFFKLRVCSISYPHNWQLKFRSPLFIPFTSATSLMISESGSGSQKLLQFPIDLIYILKVINSSIIILYSFK